MLCSICSGDAFRGKFRIRWWFAFSCRSSEPRRCGTVHAGRVPHHQGHAPGRLICFHNGSGGKIDMSTGPAALSHIIETLTSLSSIEQVTLRRPHSFVQPVRWKHGFLARGSGLKSNTAQPSWSNSLDGNSSDHFRVCVCTVGKHFQLFSRTLRFPQRWECAIDSLDPQSNSEIPR